MNVWKVLGIEETKDKDILKNAYRQKLTGVNPEDNPQGFMELRQAYEEAVRLADAEKPEEEPSAMTPLLHAIEELYRDFSRRISLEAWERLTNRDEFVALDTSEEAFGTLFHFLMSNFYLPQRIWKYLVELFDIEERKKELSETFPEDFVNYVLNNAEYEDLINYDLFDGDASDYDTYIQKYYHLDAAIRRRDFEQQAAYIGELEALDAYHPYLELCKIRREIQLMNEELERRMEMQSEGGNEVQRPELSDVFAEQLQELQERAERLRQDVPSDIFLINICGDVSVARKDYEEAKRYYDMSLEIAPDNYNVKGEQAGILLYMGEYGKSRDIYMELLRINHYDNNVRAGMIRANEGLLREFEEKLRENPEDNKIRLEMAWSYYQSYRFHEAIDILSCFEPDEDMICEYNNVKGRTYLCLSEYENALQCFQIWRDEIERLMRTEHAEEHQDKIKRYEYANFLLADCYLKTKRYDEARKYLDIAMAKEHEEIILSYEAKCELEYETENYERCMDACEDLLKRDNRSYTGYNYMAKASYKLDYLKEAMAACEHAINLYPYAPEPYGLESDIYLRVNDANSARAVLERYREFGIESDTIDLSEARILETEKKHGEIVRLLKTVEMRSNSRDTDLEDFNEIYMMLGFHLERTGETGQAKKYYLKVRETCPEHLWVYGRLAIIAKNDGEYDEALKLYTKQLELKPSAFYYIHRGLLNRFLQNYKSALSDFQEALVLEPGNSFCYSRIGLIYEVHRNFKEALESYDKAIRYCDEEDEEELSAVYSFKARTLQCMNRFEDSRKLYEEYFERFGLNADVAYDYAELLQRMNLIDEATGILRKCIDTLEHNEDVQACIRQLCCIYGEEGYIDRANEVFMLAVSRNADDDRAYAEMAAVFLHNGLWEDAKRMYEQAIALDKERKGNYYIDLAEAVLGKKALFKPDVRPLAAKGLIRPEDMRSVRDYIKMAQLSRLIKKTKDAMKIIERGLKLKRCNGCFYSSCHEALYEKGRIYESMKLYELARDCYEEALRICGHNALYEKSLKRIEGK